MKEKGRREEERGREIERLRERGRERRRKAGRQAGNSSIKTWCPDAAFCGPSPDLHSTLHANRALKTFTSHQKVD